MRCHLLEITSLVAVGLLVGCFDSGPPHRGNGGPGSPAMDAGPDREPDEPDEPDPPSEPRQLAELNVVPGAVQVAVLGNTGVPLADGELRFSQLDFLRLLDHEGNEVAAEFDIRGTHARSGNVRWLGVQTVIDGSSPNYTLWLGPSPRRATSPARAHWHKGALVVELDGKKTVLARESDPFLQNWFVATDGRRFDGVVDNTEIENWGPLTLVARIDGHYEHAGESRHLYSMRLKFTGGVGALALEHTFTWTGSHLDLQIEELALGVAAAGEPHRVHVDRGDGVGSGWHSIDSTDSIDEGDEGVPITLTQHSVRHWGHGADGFELVSGAGVLATGGRAGHWIASETSTRTTIVGLKHLWQQFPSGLRVENGRVVASLYSGRGEAPPLDLRMQALEEFWGPAMRARVDADATLSLQRQRLIDDPTRLDPTGLSKTHELHITYSNVDGVNESVEQVMDAMTEGPLLMPSPTHTFESGVFGALAPRDPARYPELEANTDALWSDILTVRDDWGDYGFLAFGEGPHQLYDRFENGMAQASEWRYTMSLDYGFSQAAFLSFLRSGDRRIYDLATQAARYHADILMPSVDGPRRVRGDYTWSPGFPLIPWQSSGTAQTNFNTFGWSIERNLMHHYLTGDRRSLQAFEDYAARRRDLIAAAGGPQAWVDDMVANSFKNASRGSFQRLDDVSLMHLQTHDPLFLEAAEAIALAFIKPENVGGIRFEPPTVGGVPDRYPAYFFYKYRNMLSFRRIAHGPWLERVDAALIRMADWAYVTATEHYHLQESRGFGRLMATAYELTGDPKYVALALDLVRKRHNRTVAPAEVPAGGSRLYHTKGFLPIQRFVPRTSPDASVRVASVLRGDNMALNGPYLIGAIAKANAPDLYSVYLDGESSLLPLHHNPFALRLITPPNETLAFDKPEGVALEVELAASLIDVRDPSGSPVAPATIELIDVYTVDLAAFATDDPDKPTIRDRPLQRVRVTIAEDAPAGVYTIAAPSAEQTTLFASSLPFAVSSP